MNVCTCYHSTGAQPITPWTEKISSAQIENAKNHFASVAPINEKPLAVGLGTRPSAGVTKPASRSGAITVIHDKVSPYRTGYARIDNPIVDALMGKSKELKENVYDIIRNDLLPNNVHGLEDADRLALIGLGVEKAQYLADNFLDDKSKASFMESIRSIAKIATEGKRVGTCNMEYNVRHVMCVDSFDEDGHVIEGNSELFLYAMEKESPEDYATYKKMQKSSGGDDVEAAFFALRWAMKNLFLVNKNRTDYRKEKDKKYQQLQKVELDSTFSGTDTSNKKNFLASLTEKLQANQNLQVSFFLERISQMTNVQSGYLLGKQMSLFTRA